MNLRQLHQYNSNVLINSSEQAAQPDSRMRRYRRRLLLSQPQLCSPVQLRNGQIEVWHQRISISCWAGACAVGRCGRRMSVKNMQCDQRGARSGARRERRPSPFPSCTRPRLCVVVKGGGQRTRREQQRSPAPMGGQLTLVGFSAVDTYRGRP